MKFKFQKNRTHRTSPTHRTSHTSHIARAHTHRLSQKWYAASFPRVIDKDHWPPNSPNLNPLDYFVWDECVHQIRWDKVRSKQTLIDELKVAVKRIRLDKVAESYSCWTNRLYRMARNNGGYLSN